MRDRAALYLRAILAAEEPPPLQFEASLAFDAAPPPKIELPPGFSGHDYAVFLLHIAAEIEHALMVQYLYAAYSLGGPDVPEAERDTVRRWQDILLGIAKEEMAHFVTVQNVLRLIGGPLNLERDDYPWNIPYAPFCFTLEPLSRQSLARYVYIESPETWPADAEPLKAEIEKLASEGQSRTPNQVGKLYRLMIALLSDADLVPEQLFQEGTLPYQASWDEWGRGYRDGARGAVAPGEVTPDLIIEAAYSRGTAVAALKAVAEQGEAADAVLDEGAVGEKSHFRRFLEIFRDYPDDDAGWCPVRPLAANPTTVEGIEGNTYIGDATSRLWAQLLNLRYRMLLTYLGHSFRLSGARGADRDARARGMVLNATFAEMYNLRAISRMLVGLPCGGGDPALRAGPSFEIPYSLQLPAEDDDVWRLHLDLFDAAAALIEQLKPAAHDEGRRYLETLAGLDLGKKAAIEAILGTRPAAAGGRPQMGRLA